MREQVGKSRLPHSAASINPTLDKSLVAYVAAASAAGVGLVAAAQPAEAKVVYTPTNVTLGHNSSYSIDLNNDGVADFEISNFFYQYARQVPLGAHQNTLTVKPQKQANRAVRAASSLNGAAYAAALAPHKQVGPNSPFQAGYSDLIMANSGGSAYSTVLRGPWFTHRQAYLGVKFVINGISHYGWVRVTVSGYLSSYTIVGYAYETVPNTPISTGQTSGPARISAMQPTSGISAPQHAIASLGALARGTDGLPIWRRDMTVTAVIREESSKVQE
ncbi:MAG TPA: hypothetical protein VI386_05210 [Candidatus Sulfotelmatobacter sp.]